VAGRIARLLKLGGGAVLAVGVVLFLLGLHSAIGVAFAGLCSAAAGFALADMLGGSASSDGWSGGDGDGGSDGDGGGGSDGGGE
jgi:hypothetical protein